MFSGIVQNKQLITNVKTENGIIRIKVQRPQEFTQIQNGDSIAVDGVCLTVEDFNANEIQFAYAAESIQLLKLQAETLLGKNVNLERSLSLSSPIHGHLVSGHVEALGKLLTTHQDGSSLWLEVSIPNRLQRYVWEKGGITINGVSLTANKVFESSTPEHFTVSVCIIPETLLRTNLGSLAPGHAVNIESDYFAKIILNQNRNLLAQDFQSDLAVGVPTSLAELLDLKSPLIATEGRHSRDPKGLQSQDSPIMATTKFSTIPDLIEDIHQGKMVILVDDEDRENEGDLILAAPLVTAEKINFMAKEARGLICLSLTPEQCDQLHLPMMISELNNQTPHKTAFTVSIEAAVGISTGISAKDRAQTILVASNPQAKPSDIIMPGHVFPLRAKPGGVLERQGHTEGSIDLVKFAGLSGAAVICEVINDDGTMARVPDLLKFASKHQLKMGTIKELVQYKINLSKNDGINNEKAQKKSEVRQPEVHN